MRHPFRVRTALPPTIWADGRPVNRCVGERHDHAHVRSSFRGPDNFQGRHEVVQTSSAAHEGRYQFATTRRNTVIFTSFLDRGLCSILFQGLVSDMDWI